MYYVCTVKGGKIFGESGIFFRYWEDYPHQIFTRKLEILK